MSRIKRNTAPSRRKQRSQRKQVDSTDKQDEEIYECIVVRFPGEIGARGETREGVSTPKTTGGVAQAVDSAEHVTCPNDTLPVRASGARNTRSQAQTRAFAQESEQSAFTPARGVRPRRSACGNRIHKAPYGEMNGIFTPPQPAATRERKARVADTPETNPPARRGARDTSNHDPAAPIAETPKPILRRSTRKIPVSYPPPAETGRSLARPARRPRAQVSRDSGVIMFRSEIDYDIPTEFEESNVRADLTDRPAIPVGRGWGLSRGG
ncbi:hypothetical protein HOY80DRAFT_1017987 [Tuber brumale]|nr:hypothetical protein HOY80DRAFT_1017987 [Tuber brumale]